MNYMYYAYNDINYESKDKIVKNAIAEAKDCIKVNKVKISSEFKKIGNCLYYHNCLPYVDISRDVLTKAYTVCTTKINWKNIKLQDLSQLDSLKTQYGWNISIVDKDHTRNNYRNKETCWCIFDTESKAKKYLEYFNSMFRTALEQDCIDEYKKFKQNPAKRVLTFNAVLFNAYDLYDLVDKKLA